MTITKLFGSLSVAALLASNVAQAHASAIQLTALSDLSAGDTVATYPGSASNPFSVVADGVTLTFSTPIAFNIFEQDGSFAPEFPSGARVLFNLLDGPLTISFSDGIGEVGFFAQGFTPDSPQAFTVNVFDQSSLLKMFTVGPDPNAGFPGNALFVGAQATNGDLITRLTISNIEPSDDPSFVIGSVTFGEAVNAEPVPEPTSLLLLGSGLLYGARRLRRRSV